MQRNKIKYKEDMIRVNRESANRLLEEAQMLMSENNKSRDADDLRKKHEGFGKEMEEKIQES